jgi:hypothetical protein
LTAAGLTYERFEHSPCTATFALPDPVAGLCGRAVLLFTGKSAIVDFRPAQAAVRQVMHAGCPWLQFGQMTGYGWGLTNTTATVDNSILSLEFLAQYLGARTITRIGGSGLSPSAFSSLYTLVSGLKTRPLLVGDVDATAFLSSQTDDPLVIGFASKPTPVTPFAEFNSIGITASIGLEDIPLAEMRSDVVSLLFKYATEKVGGYTLESSGTEPEFTLTLSCSTFNPDVVIVAWGDGKTKHFFKQTSPTFAMTHRFTTAGSYTPTVIVQTALGRVFALNTSTIKPFAIINDWPEISSSSLSSIPALGFALAMIIFALVDH